MDLREKVGAVILLAIGLTPAVGIGIAIAGANEKAPMPIRVTFDNQYSKVVAQCIGTDMLYTLEKTNTSYDVAISIAVSPNHPMCKLNLHP